MRRALSVVDDQPVNTRMPQSFRPLAAQRQAGAFTRAQARAGGLTKAQVAYRIKAGTLHSLVGMALRHCDDPVTPQMLAFGAYLTWPDAVLCGPTAAALNGAPLKLLDAHVITHRQPKAVRGLWPHHFEIAQWERDSWNGIKTTSPTRSLIDALVILPEPEAELLFSWAYTRRRLGVADFEVHLEHYPGRWGNNRLRRFLANAKAGIMSPAEALLHKILTHAGLTGWQADVTIRCGKQILARVDVLFSAQRVVVEVDGRRFHGQDRFQADRTRDNLLQSAGYTVLRFTWEDLTMRPHEVVNRIRQTLEMRTTNRR